MLSGAASRRSGGRTFLVLALSLFILVSGAADLFRLQWPIGVFGTIANGDGVIAHVAPGSPADRAGIRPGDRIDIAALSPQNRWFFFPQNCTSPGIPIDVGFFRGGMRYSVHMVSVPEPMEFSERAAIVADVLAGLLFVLIGTITVLLRPSAIVWGFYLFCLGSAPFPYRELDATLRLPTSFIWLSLIVIVASAALPGLLIFSVRMLQDSVSGWRLWIGRCAWVLFVASATLSVASLASTYLMGRPTAWIDAWDYRASLFLTALILLVLGVTYVRAVGADRQRLRWVVIGSFIALAAPYVQQLLVGLLAGTPALYDAIAVIGAAAPVGVAYAIIKHRVINVSFFVSRTIVYGTITAVLVAAFAFIDWLVGKVLDQSRLAIVAEVLTAVGIGFWMNSLHRRIDRIVDGVLFRSRHAADRALMRFASGLPHAASFELVDEILAEESAAALGLASAALFRRTSPHRFERMAAVGWDETTATCLDERDRLLLQIEGERQVLRLSEIRWRRADLPSAPGEPALAIPIFVRHELGAVLILGSHMTGEEFDADELQLLSACAIAAGAAYDHLEADALRKRMEELQRTVDALRSSMQTQGLPAAT